jgi:diguanylate cyclase (GGDEF)-like protein
MKARYTTLALYALCLSGIAGALLISQWEQLSDWPRFGVVLFGILASLFVWQFGVQAPRVGLISMERVPQIGLLLVFNPAVAAGICALASMLWPLLSRRYSHGSAVFGSIRALHNASMTVLMLLAAGHAYLAVGGEHPLTSFSWRTVGALLIMTVVAQVVNISIMALFFKFDGREVRRIITPAYALSDLIFVPAGVLAALLYNSDAHAALILFIALMALFVLSFNSLGHAWNAPKEDPNPLARLFNVGRVLHGARHVGELGVRILSETHSLLRFDEFYFVLVDRERGVLDVRVHERKGERLAQRTKPIDVGMFGWVIEHAQPVLVEDYFKAPADVQQRVQPTEKETGSFIVVPLIDAGNVLGLLSVQHTQPGLYSSADLHLMQKLAEQVAPAAIDALAFEDLENYRRRLEERVAERTLEIEKTNLEKERLIAVLRERSQTLERESQEDPLTGVANRRFFGKRLAAEIEVAQAINQPLVVAIADLDSFKLVNDKLGHAIGDETLRRSAALMRAQCREGDVIARIGGDEFALLFPAIELKEAAELCEKLRSAIETHPWHEIHPTLRVSVSIGITQWDGATEVEELLEAADSQLYIAKLSGRNRVEAGEKRL